jgi:hypothetical protein
MATSRSTCAIDGEVVSRRLTPIGRESYDILEFLKSREIECQQAIRAHIERYRGARWYLCLRARLSKLSSAEGGEVTYSEPYFRCRSITSYEGEDLNHPYTRATMSILDNFDIFVGQASGWNFENNIHLDLIVVSHIPLRPSGYIPLPSKIRAKRAIVNIVSDDNLCFLWCVLAHLYPPINNANRVSNYRKYTGEVNLDGIDMPMRVSQISDFEKQNPSLAINVFALDTDGETEVVYPYRISKNRARLRHIDLLLLRESDREHYCLISSLSRLVGKNYRRTQFYCRLCLNSFGREDLLADHIRYCGTYAPQRTRMPTPDKAYLNYIERGYGERLNFVIYCDLECSLNPIASCLPNPNTSAGSTTRISEHAPTGFAYLVTCNVVKHSKKVCVYRGDDCVDKLLACLMQEGREIANILNTCVPIRLNAAVHAAHAAAVLCYMCKGPFTSEPGGSPVLDHCHVSGIYRGSLHSSCNLKRKQSKRVVVIFHNGSFYDFPLLLNRIGLIPDVNIKCVPGAGDTYRSFTLNNLHFVDSFAFMGTSLESLARNLLTGGRHLFKNIASQFAPEHVDDLLQKMCYPYEFVTSLAVLEQTTSCPPREAFYSALTNTNISQCEYERAQRIWSAHDCSNLGQFQDLYVAVDTLLLADVFERFRDVCMTQYGLDPAHYITIASYAHDACLKHTGIVISLMTCPTMYSFIESNIRGGVAQVCLRRSLANNPLMLDSYNPEIERSYITYYDTNAMYAYAMSSCVAHGECVWLSRSELDTLDISSIPSDGCYGYVLEVDLEYGSHLHRSHNQVNMHYSYTGCTSISCIALI